MPKPFLRTLVQSILCIECTRVPTRTVERCEDCGGTMVTIYIDRKDAQLIESKHDVFPWKEIT